MQDEIKNMNGREVMNNIRKTGLSVMAWCRKNDVCYETTLGMLQGHPGKRDKEVASVILEKLKAEGLYVAL
jgi:lambda repressor-like predicted transcriptional regulator